MPEAPPSLPEVPAHVRATSERAAAPTTARRAWFAFNSNSRGDCDHRAGGAGRSVTERRDTCYNGQRLRQVVAGSLLSTEASAQAATSEVTEASIATEVPTLVATTAVIGASD